MTKAQYYLDGAPFLLGKQIGRGGEGEIYLASNDPKIAVKIYTSSTNAQREAKVSSMVKYKLAYKTSLVAFPKGIVKTKAGAFVGFAMNLVTGHRPLHEVYGPKSRKIHFPNADYRFLIRVATNVARAIGQVHQTNCVVGDINHSGILVSNDATVAIIDADSFQFEAGGTHFPCLVGVPDFTPPELQGKSLNGVVRTKHHDNFGLAVAIFQLLFMGRHPYAGRHPDSNLSLEQAIEKNLFAYSLLRKTQMTPPALVTLDYFPSDIANAFERAFGIDYLSRPDPAEWVEVLKRLEFQLSRCDVYPIHYYPSSGKNCPWCRMEYSSGAILFIAPFAISSATYTIHSNMSIDKIWEDIESISIPKINSINPKLESSSVVSPSLDAQQSVLSIQGKKIFTVLGVIAAICAWIYAPALFIIWIFVIIFCVSQLSNISINKSVWIERYKKADHIFNEALGAWRQRSGVTKLYEIRSSLESAADEFRSLSALKSQALSQLMKERRNNQLIDYLDRHLLSRASISGIEHNKKAILASFGIESAADIKESEIIDIPGFGEVTTEKLLAWRAGIERKFVYNSKILSADIKAQDKIENDFNKQADALLKRLSSGGAELRQILNQVHARLNNSDLNLNRLAAARAQIEADLKFLGIPKPTSISNQTVSPPVASKGSINSPQRTPANTINAPRCYRCGAIMVRRTARKGRNPGNSFWGCSAFPRCRAIRP